MNVLALPAMFDQNSLIIFRKLSLSLTMGLCCKIGFWYLTSAIQL